MVLAPSNPAPCYLGGEPDLAPLSAPALHPALRQHASVPSHSTIHGDRSSELRLSIFTSTRRSKLSSRVSIFVNEDTMTNSSSASVIVGVDVGALSTKVTLLLSSSRTSNSTNNYEIVRNAHGGHTTPTAITFAGLTRPRLLGEDAIDVARGDENTVGLLTRLLLLGTSTGSSDSESDSIENYVRFQYDKESQCVCIPNMEEKYDATALVGMLLGRVKRNVLDTILRLRGGDNSNAEDKLEFVFVIPPTCPSSSTPSDYERLKNAFMNAAYAASINNSRVVESSECLAALYQHKFYDNYDGNDHKLGSSGDEKVEAKKILLIVEMGHANSCVSVLQCGADAEDGEEKKICDEDEEQQEASKGITNKRGGNSNQVVQVLSTISSSNLGAANIDIALYHHFLSNHPSLSHHKNTTTTTFNPNSRPSQRLMEGCNKLKHLLSMLPEGNVTVEAIGKDDSDVMLSGNRELLKSLCQETVVNTLKGMIGLAIEKAGGRVGGDVSGDIDAVEITGGGTRIPMIQDAIRDAIGKSDDFVLSKSFDDTSLAFGALLIPPPEAEGEEDDPSSFSSSNNNVKFINAENEEKRAQLREKESTMAMRDAELMRKDEIRNQIEGHLLELRSARYSSHGSLLPSSDEFTSHLDDNDEWLFSDECDLATVEAIEAKWIQIQSKTKELCADYLAAKQADAERKEKELEEEAKRAAAEHDAEAAANSGDGEVDDHDTRRLPFKRRMEIVLKNKAEANELFSGGNYQHAAARYAKALSHCAKFFDLSADQQNEVNEVKLSLILNLAFAYIKLDKLDNALVQCNGALEIDATSVKALYRRATVLYQKRKFDEASKDLDKAEKLAPDDTAVKKLRGLVSKQLMKQKAKEKAMAKKMFG